jgi:hypothetical protein
VTANAVAKLGGDSGAWGAVPTKFAAIFFAASESFVWMRRVNSFCRSGVTKGVFACHFQIAVAGDLRRLDGASADPLPPGDVGGPGRVRPKQTTSSSSTA